MNTFFALFLAHALINNPSASVEVSMARRPGGLVIKFDGSKSYDPDGYIVAYHWKQIGLSPAKIDFSNPDSVITRAAPLAWSLGIYVIELEVTDNLGAKGRSTVRVTVSADTPPVIDVGPDYTTFNTTITLFAKASDVDGQDLKYSWKKISGYAAKIESPTAARTNVSGLQKGVTHEFECTVNDGQGGIKMDRVRVYVKRRFWFW